MILISQSAYQYFDRFFPDAPAIGPYNQTAVSKARSQYISGGFVRSLVPFPLTSTMRWDQVATPEIVNYWASFSKASRGFQGGLIFPCSRGATHLFCYGTVPLNCLRQ